MTAPVARWDAVVVGAGPAGSATALRLARAGAAVLLLDRARFPRDKPCSEYLSPGTVRELERLDPEVLRAVERARPARLSGMKVVAPDGRAMVGRFAGPQRWPSPWPCAYALPRTALDAILRRAAERAGAEVREGVAVESLVYDHGAVSGVIGRTDDGRRMTVLGRLVVGADGLRSVVARRLGLRRFGRPRRIAFAAHVTGVAAVGDVGEMHVSPEGGGYVGLGPIGGGETTVALVLPAAAARPTLREEDAFFAALDRFPGLRGRFASARVTRPVLAAGPFAQWVRAAVAPGGGACVVGDAADFFDPFTGQGIYAALRGAALLADTAGPALLEGDGPVAAAALRPYAAARRRAFAGKWLLERLIAVGVGIPALADHVIGRLARRPDLADLVVGATGNFVPARAVLGPRALAGLLA